jgi:hypothetical protein
MERVLMVGGSPHKKKNFLARANFLEAQIPKSVYLYTSNLTPPPKQKMEIFRSYTGSLALLGVQPIQELAKKMAVTMIGSDLGDDFDAKKALLAIVNLSSPIILEDDALRPELLRVYNDQKNNWLLLFETDQDFTRVFQSSIVNPDEISQKYKMNFYYKGQYFCYQEGYFSFLKGLHLEGGLLSARIASHLILR